MKCWISRFNMVAQTHTKTLSYVRHVNCGRLWRQTLRQVWRYQRGNYQKPLIEEQQKRAKEQRTIYKTWLEAGIAYLSQASVFTPVLVRSVILNCLAYCVVLFLFCFLFFVFYFCLFVCLFFICQRLVSEWTQVLQKGNKSWITHGTDCFYDIFIFICEFVKQLICSGQPKHGGDANTNMLYVTYNYWHVF